MEPEMSKLDDFIGNAFAYSIVLFIVCVILAASSLIINKGLLSCDNRWLPTEECKPCQ